MVIITRPDVPFIISDFSGHEYHHHIQIYFVYHWNSKYQPSMKNIHTAREFVVLSVTFSRLCITKRKVASTLFAHHWVLLTACLVFVQLALRILDAPSPPSVHLLPNNFSSCVLHCALTVWSYCSTSMCLRICSAQQQSLDITAAAVV